MWTSSIAGTVAALPAVHDSVVTMLDHAVADFGERQALVQDDQALTFTELRRCVSGLAMRLREAAPKGGRIATILGNSMVAAVAPYAIAEAACVHVPLNPLYTPRELAYMLDDSAPVLVILDDALVPLVKPLLAGAPGCGLLPASGFAEQFPAWRAAPERLTDKSHHPRPDEIALVQYTGGSTGRPKGVQLTHRAINTNIAQREALLPVARGRENVLCVMPLFHSYAMAMGLYLCGYSANTLVILPGYHPERLLEAVERHAITIFPGSPTIFVGLMNCERFASTRWSRVHTCYSGSAALSEQTLQQWEAATGSRIFEGYGQTEAGPVLTFNPATGKTKIGSVGIPVPATQVEIVDVEQGTDVLPRGERGEIRARGPQVMSGYLNLEEETRESLRGGWLYTGDIGEIDADGYLFIRDRKKDLVIVGGYNVYPREVEEVLYAHPAVLEAAVVGQPDAYRGEILRAYVALRPEALQVTGDELQAHCKLHLAKYKVPALFEFLPQLPKTSVNKIDKKPLKLRAREAAGDASA
ncbi:long-chain fatty acid--CoA ligase [Ramlibacter henchirensis]|uniref:Long-chain fatty acid--CoA ligase n=1 Tax=Ramlibacter henchirensis TaxID=204072 RepID=A0A4Z0BQ15_9BURK|nr:AMP-binding protein [Ramlibacter henchirensis]TFZ00862.1 long-chain fatty acid--CoA ligase [Ramlibacter henchirensis]